jgi:murein DD-endopeptidase MepM/ murein hydrolase activator NlpD
LSKRVLNLFFIVFIFLTNELYAVGGKGLTSVTAGYQTFVYPLMTERITSRYGIRKHPVRGVVRHHHGMDLAAKENTPILSIATGKVIFAGYFGAYGNYISILHDNGYSSHYGHCRIINARIGQNIKAGQLIGTVGSTGVVTGPHLHFELRLQGRSIDPEQFIPDIATKAEG